MSKIVKTFCHYCIELNQQIQHTTLCHVHKYKVQANMPCAHNINKDGIKRIRVGIRIRYLYARKIRQILRIAAFLWRMETIANFLKRFP